jgi:glutamate synthase domain-containing protein 3
VAYVLDRNGDFEKRCNRAMVNLERLGAAEETKTLRGLIYRHLEATDSARAKEILDQWSEFEPVFWKVTPLPPVGPKAPLAPNNVPPGPTDLGKA